MDSNLFCYLIATLSLVITGQNIYEQTQINCSTDDVYTSNCLRPPCTDKCVELSSLFMNANWRPRYDTENESTIIIHRTNGKPITALALFACDDCNHQLQKPCSVDLRTTIPYVVVGNSVLKRVLKQDYFGDYIGYLLDIPPTKNVTITLHAKPNECYFVYYIHLYSISDAGNTRYLTLDDDIDQIICSTSNPPHKQSCLELYDENYDEIWKRNNKDTTLSVQFIFKREMKLNVMRAYVQPNECSNRNVSVTVKISAFQSMASILLTTPKDYAGYISFNLHGVDKPVKDVIFEFNCGQQSIHIVEIELYGTDYIHPTVAETPSTKITTTATPTDIIVSSTQPQNNQAGTTTDSSQLTTGYNLNSKPSTVERQFATHTVPTMTQLVYIATTKATQTTEQQFESTSEFPSKVSAQSTTITGSSTATTSLSTTTTPITQPSITVASKSTVTTSDIKDLSSTNIITTSSFITTSKEGVTSNNTKSEGLYTTLPISTTQGQNTTLSETLEQTRLPTQKSTTTIAPKGTDTVTNPTDSRQMSSVDTSIRIFQTLPVTEAPTTTAEKSTKDFAHTTEATITSISPKPVSPSDKITTTVSTMTDPASTVTSQIISTTPEETTMIFTTTNKEYSTREESTEDSSSTIARTSPEVSTKISTTTSKEYSSMSGKETTKTDNKVTQVPTTADIRPVAGVVEGYFSASSEVFIPAYANNNTPEYQAKSNQYTAYLTASYTNVSTSGISTAFIAIEDLIFTQGSIGTTYTVNFADKIPVSTDNNVRNGIVNSITNTFAKNNITVDPNSFKFVDKTPTTAPPTAGTETVLLAGILGSVVTLLVVALAIALVVIRMCIKGQRQLPPEEQEHNQSSRLHRQSSSDIINNNNILLQFQQHHGLPAFFTSSFRGHPGRPQPPPPYERRHSMDNLFDFPTPMSHLSSNDRRPDDGSSLSGHGVHNKHRSKRERERRDSDNPSSLGGYMPKRTEVPALSPSKNMYEQSTSFQDQSGRNDQRHFDHPTSPNPRIYREQTSVESHNSSNVHNRIFNGSAINNLRRNTQSEVQNNQDVNRSIIHNNQNHGNIQDLHSEYTHYYQSPEQHHRHRLPRGSRDISDLLTEYVEEYESSNHHHRSNRGTETGEPDNVLFRGADGNIHTRNVHGDQGRLRLHRTVSHDSEQSHSRVNGHSNEGYDDDALTPYYMVEESAEPSGLLGRLSKSLSGRMKSDDENEHVHRRPPSYMEKARNSKKQSNA